jgi:hypothetical protein
MVFMLTFNGDVHTGIVVGGLPDYRQGRESGNGLDQSAEIQNQRCRMKSRSGVAIRLSTAGN